MNALEQIAGRLILHPGRPLPNIERRRPIGLERLFRGRPAQALPRLLASVYTLCGHAHRFTAQRAIDAARGRIQAPGDAALAELRHPTEREHVRRIAFDWPALAGIDPARSLAVLQASPALAAAAPHHGAMAAWLRAEVLAMPVEAWLAGWQRGGEAWLADWCERADTPAALALRVARVPAQRVAIDAHPLRLRADAPAATELARALAASADFVAAPQLDGSCAETGTWTRIKFSSDSPVQNAWMRLASRLHDLARLSLADGAGWLEHGALATGRDEGLAWSETARGLLVHWVRLDGDAVADVRVLAPTDWNFHPRGVVAQALADVPVDASESARAEARWLIAAFDPCVAHELCSTHDQGAVCA